MIDIVLALVLGLGAGVLAGLFGVGGGILFVPTLIIVFGLGQVEAEATSLLAILPTVAAGDVAPAALWQRSLACGSRHRSVCGRRRRDRRAHGDVDP